MRKKMMIGSILPAQRLHPWQLLTAVLMVAGLFSTFHAVHSVFAFITIAFILDDHKDCFAIGARIGDIQYS